MNRIPKMATQSILWTSARWIVLLVTVGLIGAFFLWPEWSLAILWYALIPILPAVFLVNVELWRNVCPLATLNLLGGQRIGSRKLAPPVAQYTVALGIVLLAVLVPARRFLFNADATWLGITVIAVCVLAVAGGFLFDMKAGFCNAFCPVLPVERLYGQRPLLTVPNARCTPCTACTKSGCLDIVPERSALLALGSQSTRWVLSAYGVFALAFPGFVAAYYLLGDVPTSMWASVYAQMGLWSIGSFSILAAAFTLGKVPAAQGLVFCAGVTAAIYYWFAPPGIAEAFALPSSFTWGVRLLTLSLVAVWTSKGLAAR